ncbi:hypothetical protein V866_001867 [Kwoniella sp. B9012]
MCFVEVADFKPDYHEDLDLHDGEAIATIRKSSLRGNQLTRLVDDAIHFHGDMVHGQVGVENSIGENNIHTDLDLPADGGAGVSDGFNKKYANNKDVMHFVVLMTSAIKEQYTSEKFDKWT